jgi:phenylpyruvate tautomerase PptA (4-oxalocrotonate tautomerase family)
MPIIQVQLLEGQSPGVKTRLANALTDAFLMVIPAPAASMTIVLQELERENYMRGGALRRGEDGFEDPVKTMLAYLAAVETEDRDTAHGHMTEDCEFHLPGGVVVRSPFEVVEWARNRSRIMGFSVTSTDTSPGEHGPVVHLRGMLSGEWNDGVPFDGVRMSTRYEFARDKIRRVDLWNDLADHAAARGGFPPRP